MIRALHAELRQVGSKVAVFLADPRLVDTAMSRRHFEARVARHGCRNWSAASARGTQCAAADRSEADRTTPIHGRGRSGGLFTPDTSTGTFQSL